MGKKIFLCVALLLCCMALMAKDGRWECGRLLTEQEVRNRGVDSFFCITEIDDATFRRMRKGGSFPDGCSVRRSDLRYLRLLHYNYDGQIVCGEMVCNKAIARDLVEVFKELFAAKYEIERMQLIDDYHADDETSMRANNTSAFCYRCIAGRKTLSLHARGMAVDINPLHNPMVKRDAKGRIVKIQPDTDVARRYANRNTSLRHAINRNDVCYKAFVRHGFAWGGAWKSSKDYQHFEKK